MQYKIAIPSYQRADQLREKTLKTLERYEINPNLVDIFVANLDEFKIYSKMLGETPYASSNLIVGVKGMGAIRNFIRTYYPEGSKILHLDDDIQDILRKVDDKKMESITSIETEVIFPGFKALEEHGANLFGIYAAANAMFMKHRISVGLYYCIGSCWGNIIRHDQDLMVTMDDKEDFERTLQYYVKDGKIVRLDNITIKTKYYGTGGMASARTEDTITQGAKTLVERYPDLCTMFVRETTGHAELRLRDTRKEKSIPVTTLEEFFG